MKRLILLAFIILMSNISFSQTNVGGHMIEKVFDNGKAGCKVDGKLIVPCEFKNIEVRDMGEYGGLVIGAKSTNYLLGDRIYDIDGNILVSEHSIYSLWGGEHPNYPPLLRQGYSSWRRGNGFGFFDISGKFVYAKFFVKSSDGEIFTTYYFTPECNEPCDVEYAGKIIIPRSKGLVITGAEHSDILGDLFIDDQNRYYDRKGDFLFEKKNGFPSVNDILGKVGGVVYIKTRSNGFFGVSTSDKKEILSPEFTKVEMIAGKNILYEMNGMQGVMTLQGKHIIPLSRGYTSITWSQTFKCYNFEKFGYKGTCNANGVQTSITKVAPPPTQTPSQPASNNQPRQQQQPSQGSQPDVKVPAYMPCPTCGGTLHCPTCAGTGSYWSGSDKRRCGVCNGTGVCQSCHGTGTNAVIYH